MGYYENQLKAITTSSAWEITQLDKLKSEMSELQDLMTDIAASPGWTGTSADDARERLAELRKVFNDIESKLSQARLAINAANAALTRADNAHATLPGTLIPSWVYDEVAKATAGTKISIPFVGEFYVETAISRLEAFFGSQRESAAHAALTTLQTELRAPRAQLEAAQLDKTWPESFEEPMEPAPTWGGDDNGVGGFGPGYGGHGGGSYTGGGGGGTYVSAPWPPRVIPDGPPTGWPRTTIGIDGEIVPGSIHTGSVGGGGGGLAGGLGGGGLGAGLIGAGAGGAALLAGSKLASGGGAGMFGGAGAGAGAAGGKSSSAMMGGAPGGGGGSEKEKRNGLGLIAPKLEDDDEMGPRSAAAGAGGRE
jgi:hypothetical protein